jgi:hypothetical protein
MTDGAESLYSNRENHVSSARGLHTTKSSERIRAVVERGATRIASGPRVHDRSRQCLMRAVGSSTGAAGTAVGSATGASTIAAG